MEKGSFAVVPISTPVLEVLSTLRWRRHTAGSKNWQGALCCRWSRVRKSERGLRYECLQPKPAWCLKQLKADVEPMIIFWVGLGGCTLVGLMYGGTLYLTWPAWSHASLFKGPFPFSEEIVASAKLFPRSALRNSQVLFPLLMDAEQWEQVRDILLEEIALDTCQAWSTRLATTNAVLKVARIHGESVHPWLITALPKQPGLQQNNNRPGRESRRHSHEDVRVHLLHYRCLFTHHFSHGTQGYPAVVRTQWECHISNAWGKRGQAQAD